ncbi:2-oxoacid:ferredoxin oxidoreductase subunit gamma [Candidatus Pyrohabitans sp.]
MRVEVRFSGFGGQGIVTAGIILARAASIHDGKQAVQTQSYGPEARGGASRSEVVISDEEILYPKVLRPDIFVVMSGEAMQKYLRDLKKGGVVIYDSSLIKTPPAKGSAYPVPATLLAKREVGKPIVANIILLGALTAITGVVSREAMEKAVLESVPKGTEEMNRKALHIGFAEGEKLVRAQPRSRCLSPGS